MRHNQADAKIRLCALVIIPFVCAGCCHSMLCSGPDGLPIPPPPFGTVPRELSKAVLPEYMIEPPDIVVIDALHVTPRPPYRLRTQDVLSIDVRGAFPDFPIKGAYPIQIGGIVSFGHPYGPLEVGGMTVEEAREAIQKHLEKQLKPEAITVSLAQIAGQQQVAGEHLVKPD